MDKRDARQRVKDLALAVVDAALNDSDANVPERHPSNTGAALVERLNLRRFRRKPRSGDGSEARRIYTAARFLYNTEPID
jgi:hypothetical protein